MAPKLDTGTAQSVAPDGGWGWMIVLGAAVCQFMFGCLVRSAGIMYLDLLDRYHASATVTTWSLTLSILLWSALGPLSAAMCNRFSCRLATLVGAISMPLGIIASAFAPNIIVIYITLGGFAGIGLAFTYTPSMAIINEYFCKKKGTAMAIACIGSSLGAFASPPVIDFLNNSFYGFTGGMLCFGAFSLHLFISVALFRPLSLVTPKKRTKRLKNISNLTVSTVENMDTFDKTIGAASTCGEQKKNADNENNQQKQVAMIPNNVSTKKSSLDWCLLKESSFWFISLFICLNLMAHNSSASFLPSLLLELGIDRTRGAFLLSLIGIMDSLARIPIGFIMDKEIFRDYPRRRLLVFVSLSLLCGISVTLFPFCPNYACLIFLGLLRGIAAAGFFAQRATMLSDVYGVDKVSSALGFTMIPMGLGGILGRTTGGLTKDYMDTYSPAYYISGGSLLFIALIYMGYIIYQMRAEQQTLDITSKLRPVT